MAEYRLVYRDRDSTDEKVLTIEAPTLCAAKDEARNWLNMERYEAIRWPLVDWANMDKLR